jgi:protein-S-isoprenylcysteine O-methyltransferase Ste14
MSVIIAWIITLVGTALWIYGYFVTGNPSLVDWHTYTPWWIADFLPNIESEIGLVFVCAGTVLTYWPSRGVTAESNSGQNET